MAQLSQQPQEDAPNHMANPNQVSDSIMNMRARLNNIEHMIYSLEQPQPNLDGNNLWTPANPRTPAKRKVMNKNEGSSLF